MMIRLALTASATALLLSSAAADSHKLRPRGAVAPIANSTLSVTPDRDWNRLDGNFGKSVEIWTLDGAQLNDVTFYGGIKPGSALLRERDKKRDPLPKFTAQTLLVEVPELLEQTYRTAKDIGTFKVTATRPAKFAGHNGVAFSYEFTDDDQLTRKGTARAAIVRGALYMMTFDAPRLNYFDRSASDFEKLADSAKLG